MAPQCPVNLLTLHFKDGGLVPSEDIEDKMREPWVYQECGHVFGQHDWNDVVMSKKEEEENGIRRCPMCRKVCHNLMGVAHWWVWLVGGCGSLVGMAHILFHIVGRSLCEAPISSRESIFC